MICVQQYLHCEYSVQCQSCCVRRDVIALENLKRMIKYVEWIVPRNKAK